MTMNNYKFTIDFEVSVLTDSSDKAREWINNKHYIRDAEVCNFVNIPVDSVSIYPTADTLRLMKELGEV